MKEGDFMPSSLPVFSFRAESVVVQKFRYIADKNRRSANKEMLRLVEEFVKTYEDENGIIPESEHCKFISSSKGKKRRGTKEE